MHSSILPLWCLETSAQGQDNPKIPIYRKNISNENNTSRLFTSGRFLVTTTGIESLASTLPLQVITRANKAQNSCLLVGTSYIINQHGVYFTWALYLSFCATCPPVAQSLTVELRSLGSSSSSSVLKTSYSARKRRYRQMNQFEFKKLNRDRVIWENFQTSFVV